MDTYKTGCDKSYTDNSGKIKLFHGDCLEVMQDIPDNSIDIILCDLPYGAAVNLNRQFIGIELDENYYNIAKDRIIQANAFNELS